MAGALRAVGVLVIVCTVIALVAGSVLTWKAVVSDKRQSAKALQQARQIKAGTGAKSRPFLGNEALDKQIKAIVGEEGMWLSKLVELTDGRGIKSPIDEILEKASEASEQGQDFESALNIGLVYTEIKKEAEYRRALKGFVLYFCVILASTVGPVGFGLFLIGTGEIIEHLRNTDSVWKEKRKRREEKIEKLQREAVMKE